jgi:peptidoglycan/xylan/chitin deacetylase (PgdA/CDA1 family)
MKTFTKNILKKSVGSSFFSGILSFMEKMDGRQSDLLRVITYHRIDNLKSHLNHHPGMISATPEQFTQQIKMIVQKYQVVSLQDVVDAIHNQKQLSAKSLLITFDDAYQDFAKHAWPVLKEYSLPATVFVPTGYPDQPNASFWWDRLYAALLNADSSKKIELNNKQYSLSAGNNLSQLFRIARNWIKSLPHEQAMQEVDQLCEKLNGPQVENLVMGWDELRNLAREGVTLAPHTRTHPLLNHLDLKSAMDEIIGSLDDLNEKIGGTVPVLCYPAGGVSDELVRELEQSEIEVAFTTQRGLNHLQQDSPFRLRRINVGGNTTLPVLRAQLLSQARLLNRVW